MNNQSLCERVAGYKFDWKDKLKFAKRFPVHIFHYFELRKLSSSWTTCACGNTCSVIPRDTIGEPNDVVLSELGYKFNKLIDNKEWNKAMACLNSIEDRSTELLRFILPHNAKYAALKRKRERESADRKIMECNQKIRV